LSPYVQNVGADGARTKDARLDFVCDREADRAIFMNHLDAQLAGKKSKFALPTRRLRKLEILWKGSTLHFDDKFWPRKKKNLSTPNKIKITVVPFALVILEPAARAHGLTHAA